MANACPITLNKIINKAKSKYDFGNCRFVKNLVYETLKNHSQAKKANNEVVNNVSVAKDIGAGFGFIKYVYE